MAQADLSIRASRADAPDMAGLLLDRDSLGWRIACRAGVETPFGVRQVTLSCEPQHLCPARGSLRALLHVAGFEAAVIEAHPIAAVASGQTLTAIIPVRLAPTGDGQVAAWTTPGEPVDVALHGVASFAGIEVPIDLSASLMPGS